MLNMLKRILFVTMFFLCGVSLLWAGTVTVDGVGHGSLKSMSVDQSGNVNIICDNGVVTYSDPSQITAPLLVASDPNMLNGEAKGIQTVAQGQAKYYKFFLPAQCNKVTVNWTTFDWIGEVDMLVKKDSLPTLIDYNNAVAGGYPAKGSGPLLWYNMFDYSGDGGETVVLSYVSAGTYSIMMKNTNSVSSKYKVWYTPCCTCVR